MAHRFFSLAAALSLALHVGAPQANSQTGNQVSGRSVFRSACPFDREEVNTDGRMQDQAPRAADPAVARIVIVEWRIRKGRECEFLSYWSTRATISNRTGLIAEFLSEVDQQRWIQWSTDEDSTTFYNIGLWRDAADFEEQIGRFIDLDRPPLEFEAAKRRRVFLAPARWRVGGTGLPLADPPGVR
jgi:hypothetical protein